MSRKADSAQSVPAALDAIMLDESWQIGLTDEQRSDLVAWARQQLSGAFEAALLDVRMRLTEIHRVPETDRAEVIQVLVTGQWSEVKAFPWK